MTALIPWYRMLSRILLTGGLLMACSSAWAEWDDSNLTLVDVVVQDDGCHWLLQHQDGHSWIEQVSAEGDLIPGFGVQGRVPLDGRGLLLQWDPEHSALLVLVVTNTGQEQLQVLDADTGQRLRHQPVHGWLWLSSGKATPYPAMLMQHHRTPQGVVLPFVQWSDGRIWYAGQTSRDFMIRVTRTTVEPELRFGRTTSGSGECLVKADVATLDTYCTESAKCGTNNGVLFHTRINNLLVNKVSTNINLQVDTEVITRVTTEINILTNIALKMKTRIRAYVEVENDVKIQNTINTKVNAEVATIKGQLEGDFDTTARAATIEADVEADFMVQTELQVKIGQIDTQLALQSEIDLSLQAELTGAEADVNAAAFVGGGSGLGVGILLSVPVTVLLYNKLHNGRWWCW